ncbi:MAG: sigma-70 family RNA polymerase sigma factor [Bacteroidales bacterium]|nr:sigma-70 family RNA polymerase sigma factor [Bacteroidales bacterium]
MNVKEYNHCVRHLADDLYRFALRYANFSAAAEDAVQEVFADLWERRDKVETEGAKGWLIRSLYRRLVDMHRHDEVRRKVEFEKRGVESGEYRQHERFELKDALAKALAQLPEQQRMLVLLRDLEGYDYAEMASMTGLSEQQVGVYLFRARKTLKKLLEDYR